MNTSKSTTSSSTDHTSFVDGGGARHRRRGIVAASLISLPLLLLAIAVYQNSILDPFDNFFSSSYQKVLKGTHNPTTSNEDQVHGTGVAVDVNNRSIAPSPLPTTSTETFASSSSQPPSGAPRTTSLPRSRNSSPPPSPPPTSNTDKLLGGLLTVGFNEQSCLSRYNKYPAKQTSSSIHKPSTHLISRLRSYEDLHRKCGPRNKQYKKSIQTLGQQSATGNKTEDCKYLVWLPANGLGNRMISLVSTFLYAILTNRVLLVELGPDASGLFCEPFLNSTWILPSNFPQRHHFGKLPTYSAYHITKRTDFPPSFMFVDLQHHYPEQERYFHCDQGQQFLTTVPALVLRSDQYFAPSLFMTPSFMEELDLMFPEKETVFHHLGKYLYHPTNLVWELITRFYEANLSGANHIIGLQIRVFSHQTTPTKTIMDQITECTREHNLLPADTTTATSDDKNRQNTAAANQTTKTAILVTSLYPEYYENLTQMYSSKQIVQVYQPSHEGKQKINNHAHAVKALTEIYLLSFCDVLITSGISTFGYVAQGLSGLKPWIMDKTSGTRVPKPPCRRALSMEPCFHYPPLYDCRTRTKLVDHVSSVFRNMGKCVDLNTGVTLVG